MRVPKFVTLESTNICQLKCLGCGSTQNDYPKGFMDYEFFEAMVDQTSRMPIDPLTGKRPILVPYANGEPLLHPHITDLMEYVLEKGLDTYITSNGMVWDENLYRMLFSYPNYYQHIFSLDGMDAQVQELARPGSNYNRVLLSVLKARELKVLKGWEGDLMVKICDRGQDFETIERYIDYWLCHGIDAVIVGKMLSNFDTGGMRRFPCQYSDAQFMLIRWDQRPTLCMYGQEMMNKQPRPMPKITKDTDILEFYNSGVYQEFREEQARGIFRAPCDTCGVAYTGSGWSGKIRFRNPNLQQKEIFYRADYYNQFFSLKEKARPNAYYGYKELT